MKVKRTSIILTVLLFSGIAYHYVKANNLDNMMDTSRIVNQDDGLVSDVVPDEATAIKIAEAIWLPKYGDRIYSKKPFKAELKDSTIWIVEGTVPEGRKGGAPYIEIQKRNCKILKVTHYK